MQAMEEMELFHFPPKVTKAEAAREDLLMISSMREI